MRPLRPGKYRHIIYFQRKESIRNEDGEWINDWVDYKKKFASKTPLKADEYFSAKAINAIRTVKFNIRFDNSINENMRIVEKNNGQIKQVYEITGVIDREGLKRELEIFTEAVVSDG